MKTYLTIFIVAFLLLTACKPSNTQPESIPEDPPEGIRTALTEEPEPIPEAKPEETQLIYASGYIDVPPNNRVLVSPYFEGYVKDIKVLEGDQVRKGQLLFVLENPDYLNIQQEYLESKAQLAYLQADYERQQALAADSIASEKQLKKAASDFLVMKARYSSLKKKINLMGMSLEQLEAGNFSHSILVRAPISGSVTEVLIERASFVEATEAAVGIVNTGHLHLELEVFERDLVKLKEGQAIEFTIAGLPEQHFQGYVHLISNSIDPERRTAKVHGHISDELAARFIPGMFVEAKIKLE